MRPTVMHRALPTLGYVRYGTQLWHEGNWDLLSIRLKLPAFLPTAKWSVRSPFLSVARVRNKQIKPPSRALQVDCTSVNPSPLLCILRINTQSLNPMRLIVRDDPQSVGAYIGDYIAKRSVV